MKKYKIVNRKRFTISCVVLAIIIITLLMIIIHNWSEITYKIAYDFWSKAYSGKYLQDFLNFTK